jgi:hypothetical protein
MFSKLFQDESESSRKERAKLAFEKISSLKKEGGRDARSARMRMVLLCRAHLDKTMQAIVAGKDKPPPPQASEYQQLPAVSGDKVWVYLPQEYADLAFSLGASYQRTDITAEQAIDGMQALADQIFSLELGIYDPFMVLQFLRDETGYQGTPSSRMDASDENAEGAPATLAPPSTSTPP